MSEIGKEASLVEVATIVADALRTWFANEGDPQSGIRALPKRFALDLIPPKRDRAMSATFVHAAGLVAVAAVFGGMAFFAFVYRRPAPPDRRERAPDLFPTGATPA